MPLSFLQQMYFYGYKDWLSDLKELVDQEQVELTSTGAYHALLSKLPESYINRQILLNEYGLGYYFGQHTDFEGSSCIMSKNVNGFFPPEMAVSQDVISVLNDLNYKWVIVDESAIPIELETKNGRSGVYKLEDMKINIVARDRKLSNLLSFKRDENVTEIIDAIKQSGVFCLDGEFFGHHYKNGLFLLDSLLEELEKNYIDVVTVSEYVKYAQKTSLSSITESTWTTSDAHLKSNDLYPNWDQKNNEYHKIQWEIHNNTLDVFEPLFNKKIKIDEEKLHALPIWDYNSLSGLDDKQLAHHLKLQNLVLRSSQSDVFWWESTNTAFLSDFVKKHNKLYQKLSTGFENSEYTSFIDSKLNKLNDLLDKEQKALNS